MKPITLLTLMVGAIALSLAVRQITLSGVVESRNETGSPRLPKSGRIAGRRMDDTLLPKNPIVNRQSESSASPAQSIQARHVVNRLAEMGLTPEEATLLWSNSWWQAQEHRANRPPMPGTRTDLDTNRWPLFEEEP